MFSFFKTKAGETKASTSPEIPAVSDLDQAISALKTGPWDPHKLISALVLSDAYLLLEEASNPKSYLVLVGNNTPHIAFFSSCVRFAPAQKLHPGFVYPYKVSPWQFIKTINDGVGFVINPYSTGFVYHAVASHAAAICDIFLHKSPA